jgi:hypothetical protein
VEVAKALQQRAQARKREIAEQKDADEDEELTDTCGMESSSSSSGGMQQRQQHTMQFSTTVPTSIIQADMQGYTANLAALIQASMVPLGLADECPNICTQCQNKSCHWPVKHAEDRHWCGRCCRRDDAEDELYESDQAQAMEDTEEDPDDEVEEDTSFIQKGDQKMHLKSAK